MLFLVQSALLYWFVKSLGAINDDYYIWLTGNYKRPIAVVYHGFMMIKIWSDTLAGLRFEGLGML
jgi:hypothetical protein